MKTQPLSLAIIATLLTISAQLSAQDSTKFDLGNMHMDARFIQHITIKGEDLEKLPFKSLQDAIAIYTRGVYTLRGEIIYVIDGNINPNVDALSIYDIETITITWNAQRLVNGAIGPQQLILIKTKMGSSRETGITAAANLYITRTRDIADGKFFSPQPATLLHQYHLSAYKAFKRSNIGASANFLREAYTPSSYETDRKYDPRRLTRFRFFAWYATEIGKSSSFTVRVNTSPETTHNYYERNDIQTDQGGWFRDKSGRFILNPSLRLYTKISPSWSNEFNASYIHSKLTLDYDYLHEARQQQITTTGNEHTIAKLPQLILRDRIEYKKDIGRWSFNPSLNLLYSDGRANSQTNSAVVSTNGGPSRLSAYKWKAITRELAATPAFALNYGNVFSFHAGVQFNSYRHAFHAPKDNSIFPFFSASFDIIKAINTTSVSGLKLFGSTASANSRMDGTLLPPIVIYRYQGSVFVPVLLTQEVPEDKQSNATALGISFSSFKERFNIMYSYERQHFWELTSSVFDPAYSHLSTHDANSNIHRFNINYGTKETANIQFNTSLTAFLLNHTSKSVNLQSDPTLGYVLTTLVPDWRGGWTNTLRIKNVISGVTLMYNYNNDVTFLLLQNLYLGYRTGTHKKTTEIYISTRNLVQTKKILGTDGFIAYFGLGAKMEL